MKKLITIGQSLLDGLKWLMEGNNWLFLTPVVLISAYVLFKMIRKKETFLIFIWYFATVTILSIMLELALGLWEALTFAIIFLVIYLLVFIFHLLRRSPRGRKGRHAASSFKKRKRSK